MNQATAKGQPLGRKGTATRERLLRIGRELLGQTSAFDLTPAAICREAQMTSAGFYAYFTNVGELLFELVEQLTAAVEAADLSYLDAPADLFGAIGRMVDEVHALYAGDQALLQYRNVVSDRGDTAMMQLRTRASLPRIEKLAALIGHDGGKVQLARTERVAQAVFINAGMESLAATAQYPFEPRQFVSWRRLRDAQVSGIVRIIDPPPPLDPRE